MAFAAAVAAGYLDLRALAAPVRMRGEVVRGFGRGSKTLGIPTANLAAEAPGVAAALEGLPTGVYFGFASVGAGADASVRIWSEGAIKGGVGSIASPGGGAGGGPDGDDA